MSHVTQASTGREKIKERIGGIDSLEQFTHRSDFVRHKMIIFASVFDDVYHKFFFLFTTNLKTAFPRFFFLFPAPVISRRSRPSSFSLARSLALSAGR